MKNILISLCLALFIISASVTITLNFRPLYYHDISSLKIEETSGFSKKVIRENYDALIDYNQIGRASVLLFWQIKTDLTYVKRGQDSF